MKKILVTGGCGYVGTELVKNLIKRKYKVRVLDTQWFGKNLKENNNLEIIKGDIRSFDIKTLNNINTVIHLANVANDPSVDLNPNLSWDINVFSSFKFYEQCLKKGIKKFIFASSGSVYGISKKKKVTEDTDCRPISIYNKTKIIAEKLFINNNNNMKVYNIRPATVCGVSDRIRLDVSVNMLTYQAYKNNHITVYGGSQIRPNVHIQDLISAYNFFIEKNPPQGSYNVGFENLSILNIAKKIQIKTGAKISITRNSNDMRSYRQNSEKILKLGFKPKFGVDFAIDELIDYFKLHNKKNFKKSYNVSWMKELKKL